MDKRGSVKCFWFCRVRSPCDSSKKKELARSIPYNIFCVIGVKTSKNKSVIFDLHAQKMHDRRITIHDRCIFSARESWKSETRKLLSCVCLICTLQIRIAYKSLPRARTARNFVLFLRTLYLRTFVPDFDVTPVSASPKIACVAPSNLTSPSNKQC